MNANRNEMDDIIKQIHEIQTSKTFSPNAEIDLLKKLQTVEKRHAESATDDMAQLIGQLNALIVKVRLERTGVVDEAMKQRIEQAEANAGEDWLVHEMISKASSIELQEWIEAIHFPRIRETDNVPAKRKAADDSIDMAKSVQKKEDRIKNLIDKSILAANVLGDREKIKSAKQKQTDVEDLFEALDRLILVSEEYRSSLSGSFHPSALQNEMKQLINQIETTQEKWLEENTAENNHSTALMKLNEMIGMEEVKERVYKLYRFLQFQKSRQKQGFHMKDELSLDMVLTGQPGTGKTTIARLLAKLYFDLGMLPKSEVVEVDRSQLVGAYVGQTEENTLKVIQRALGGVLFIDEAYSLKREGASGNDYGQTAIDTLVSAMTSGEYAGKFAVILAGYPEEMRQFLHSNPGLQSRFPDSNHIYLPDYSNEELLKIAEKVAFENDYTFTHEALIRMEEKIEHARVDDTFGNARTVRDLVLDVIFQKGASISSDSEATVEDFTQIQKKDVKIDIPSFYQDPDEQLSELVGLDKIKQEMKTLSSFIEVQQKRRELELPGVPIQLHSVFVGNPGTGKTTVASIYANLLKKKGFLKRGHLVVAGRSDLVAGYTGQTALKTKKKVREALGGVLFIDEAYSLFSGQGMDFGKEAINTLVEEMTKHNENLVVVLAGYPKETEKLLNSNPGLSSRFKKFFHFEDYSIEELIEIMRRHSEKYSYTWDKQAVPFLREQLPQLKIGGNGRFATDFIDNTIQHHADRIMNTEQETDETILTVLAKEDFETAITEYK
ncbi:AAA family ATPase [Pseudalkalibacillus sp. R45]|uniref:AAA family ATPase n=1 Tax=Pseudalkalibacillus sp. R45 TaxID=3457433 RepID=UPI003FCC3372